MYLCCPLKNEKMKRFIIIASFLFCFNPLISQNIISQSEVNSIACNGGVATWSFTIDMTTNFSYQAQAFSSGSWNDFGTMVSVSIATNSFTINNLFAGQFRVVLFDAFNLPTDTSDNFMVYQPAPLFNSFTTLDHVNCFGGNDGIATVNPGGGTTPYTYLWSNGSTSNSASGLSAGLYTCIITDFNNCPSISISANITEPSTPLSASIPTQTNVSCFGNSDGTATANTSGGTAPYTYLWSDGQSTQTAIGLSPASYNCTITDFNGCVYITSSVNITQPSELLATTTKTNVSCYGGNNGTITANPSGGTAPYFYLWSDGQSTQTATGLSSGIYTCIITDANGCIKNKTVTITQPSTTLTASISQTNVSCFGGSDGSATANPSGGTAPYTYLWSDGQTTQTANGLSAITYSCTIADVNGCVFVINSIVITEPLALSVNSSSTPVSCFGGSDGSVTLTISGGTPSYSVNFLTYSLTLPNIVTTPMVISAGSYSYTITDTQGCILIDNVSVSEPTSDLIAFISQTNVSCYGGSDGSATANPSGGTAPYTYLWSDGQTTQTANGLSPSSYTCTITDFNGCVYITSSVNITQPSELLATTTKTNVSCYGGNNGTITANPSGGTAPYFYLWSDGQSTQTATGLSAGIYTCIIADANGCIKNKTVTITEPSNALILPTPSYTSISCFGGSDGTATANPSGGTAPYIYLWSDGQTTQTAIGLSLSTFTCLVTDANGCVESSFVTLIQPQPLQVQINSTEVSCNSGSDAIATAIPSGGTAPYSYIWSNGTTTPTATGLSATNYSVTVIDNNNCPSVVATVLINEPLAISALITNTDSVSCFGGDDGQIFLSVNGGNAPYTYLWSNTQTSQNASGLVAGNYTVAIYDATCNIPAFVSVPVYEPSPLSASASVQNALCFGESSGSITVNPIGGTPAYNYSWNNGQNSQVLTNQSFGIYSCLVTDYSGCTTIVQATIDQPQELLLSSPSTVSVSCFGYDDGAATIIPQGGTAPYNYFWSNGQTAQTSVNLFAGSYSVMVSDANNCLSSDTLDVDQPLQINAILTPTDVLCNGDTSGNILLNNVSGALGPVSYLWSNGNTTFLNQNLGAGTYYVTVTDTNGCFNTFNSTILEPLAISASLSSSNISVNGANDGSISTSITGGNPPYSYYWIGPNSFSSTNASINGLESGSYTLVVTDVSGCSDQFTQIINEPNCDIFISQNYNAPLCYGNTSSVFWQNNGGLAPYTNTLTNSDGIVLINGAQYQSPNVPVQLAEGVYNLVVTDAAGCLGLWNIDVIAPDSITVDLSLTDALCNGSNNGTANASVTGGNGSYNINWGSSNPNALSAGNYNLEVIDANGCSSGVINYIISDPPQLLIDSVSTTEVSCTPGNDGTATIHGSGGFLPYTYSWSNGQTSQMAQSLINGNYIAYLNDANNCQVSDNVQIVSAPALNFTIQSSEVSCIGLNDGALSAALVSGSGPITYNWSNLSNPSTIISSDSIVSNLYAGSYLFWAQDLNNCIFNQATIILEDPSTISFGLNANDITSNGANDGWINTIGLTGGQSPYTFFWTGPNGFTAITQNIATLQSGTYTLTITDANGCQFSQSAVINEPSCNVAVNVNIIQPLCHGDNGSITWSNTGGVPAYQNIITDLSLPLSLYNGFGSTGSFSLAEGYYTLQVADQYGCLDLINITITEPDPVIPEYTISDVSCFGGSDGVITVNPTGGTGVYSINYGTPNPSQLSAGTYSFTVTDNNGCQSFPFSNTYVINEPNDIIVTTNSSPVTCFNGNDGTASVSAIGGTLPYSYFWQGSGATTSNISNLNEGIYFVNVTDSNGCYSSVSLSSQVIVTEPTSALGGSINSTDVVCYGDDNGSATANPSGGTAPYSFLWSDGQTNQTAYGLLAGIYFCTVTDANGCITTLNVTINEPSEILPGLNIVSPSCYGLSDGTASISPSGGTGSYNFVWAAIPTTNSIIANLNSGWYSVVVTDSDGCNTTNSPVNFYVPQPDSLILSTSELNGTSCFNGNDGAANAIASGGTPNYNYTWLDSLGNIISINSIVNGLNAASYSVIVSDLNGCLDSAEVLISSASQLVSNITITPASCFGGNDGIATASPSGGTPPYSYQWTGGQAISTNLVYSSLNAATTYYFSVIDANGCNLYQEPVNISEPTPTVLNFSISDYNGFNISCFGSSDASITVNASGGTSPYEFSEQNILFTTDSIFTNINSGWFFLYVRDDNDCVTLDSVAITSPLILDPNIIVLNSLACVAGTDGELGSAPQGGVAPYTYFWSNFSVSNTISGLNQASYTVDVTDLNGCISSETFALNPDFEITSTTSTTLVSCTGASDGTAIIQASGGTSPYSYLWNDGVSNFSTNDTINGLSPGPYACIITDSNGCMGYDTINIIESTTSLVIDSSLTNDVSCYGGNDGSAIVYSSGGIGDYTYQWNDINSQSTQQAVGLQAGTFIITVTDSALCSVFDTVVIFEPIELDVQIISNSDISCYGLSDGSLVSSVIGGTSPYSYSWSGPNLYISNLSSIDNLFAGSYVLSVIDDKGCEDTVSWMISEPMPLSIIVDVINPLCKNDLNGIIDIQISGGNQPYDANYISGVTTYPANDSIIITGVGASSGTLYVFDSNGCEQTIPINLIEPSQLQINNVIEINPTCFNYNDGSASIEVYGGVSPYSYILLDDEDNSISSNSTSSGLGEGAYIYIVNDVNGCNDSIDISIVSPAEINITQLPSCYGSISVEASNVIGDYQIYWDNALDTIYIDGLSPGVYYATVIDSLGCTKIDSFIVNDPFNYSISDATCFSSADGSIYFENLSSSFPPYSLIVNNELLDDNIMDTYLLDNLLVNSYQIELIDNGGCEIFNSVLVVDYIGGSNCLNTPLVISPNSDGTNDTWRPATNIDEEISVTIYNRWGQIEFFDKGNSQIIEWDGTTTEGNFLPTADYYFVIRFSNQNTMPDKTGVITLIR